MTDYSEMSDFEINCKVAYHIGLYITASDLLTLVSGREI